MKGLEISEVKLSVIHANKDLRADSDFWTKEPKRNPELHYVKIRDILKTSQYGISVSMNEEKVGYPIYRMNEIHNMFCDFEVVKYADISESDFNIFKLNDRDVLFNRTNSYEWVGRTGIYRKTNNSDFTFASYLVRFVTKGEIIQPEYLTAFLNSKYGIWDVKRRSRHSINQTNVNPEEVKEIYIPLLSNKFQMLIFNNFNEAYEKSVKSKILYDAAENVLLSTLNMTNYKESAEPVNIKSFKDSYIKTGRIDAEFYQKKYEEFEKLIYRYSNGYLPLSKVCNFKDENFNPEELTEYKYIELADIGNSGEITGCTSALGADLPTRARRRVVTNDVIVSSIEGSLSSCALVNAEYNNALCSTGFYVINSDRINSETLLTLFKSEPMQNILKKNCSGTILTSINKSEFQNIPVPLIGQKVQKGIKEKISESFKLKKESENLLEVAKRAVEIAIEEGENKAMKWINDIIKV